MRRETGAKAGGLKSGARFGMVGGVAALTAGAFCADGAAAQGRTTGLEASASIDVANNPYFESSDTGAQASATLDLQPYMSIDRGIDRFDLRGMARVRQYVDEFGTDYNVGANGRYERRTSDTVTLFASLGGSHGRAGLGNLLAPPGLDLLPGDGLNGTGVPAIGAPAVGVPTAGFPVVGALPQDMLLTNDVTLLGRRARSTSVFVDAGAAWRVSDRTRIDGEAGYRIFRFNGEGFDDFDTAFQQVRWMRALDANTSAGFIVATNQIDYKGSSAGDSIGVSPLATISRRFGDRLTATLSAGVAFARLERTPPLDRRWISPFSVDASLCRRGPVDALCASVRRSPQPSAAGGIRTADTASVSYDRRLSPRDRIGASANYSRSSAGRDELIPIRAVSFVGATGQYERVLSERLSGFVSGTFADIYESGNNRRANLGASVGVRVRFGASQ